MRALALILATWAGCLAGGRAYLQETSPRYAELGPRRIGVAVAGEAPRSAQVRIDRFGIRYPDPIEPDTRLPADDGAARFISSRLADGLITVLRSRGYEAVAMQASGARVGDLLRESEVDAVLVVSYRAVSRWPVSEFERTEIRVVGSLQEEVSHYTYDVEQGLLILPTAFLLDARTSLRLWSHSNLGLQTDRVAMGNPVRRLGVIADKDGDPPPLEELAPRAVDAVLAFYFDSIPEAPAQAPPAATEARLASLTEEAAVDRWRIHHRLVLDLGAGYARRPMSIEGPSSMDLDADAAFGGYWDVEVGLRALGRRWTHGPRLALQRSSSDYERTLLTEDDTESLEFTTAALRSATAFDLAYTLSRTWQPHRPALLAAGLGPAVTIGLFEGDQIESATHIQLGVVTEVEALWAGETLLLGPFVRAAWMLGLQGGFAPAFTAGARIGAAF